MIQHIVAFYRKYSDERPLCKHFLKQLIELHSFSQKLYRTTVQFYL